MKELFSPHEIKLGVLGGGQLGRMLLTESARLGVSAHILDPSDSAPCSKVAPHFTKGDFNDYETVMAFGKDLDILTIEIEHVNTRALADLKTQGKKVYPAPEVIRTIQDKLAQKQFYVRHAIPTVPFVAFESLNELDRSSLEFPAVHKVASGGYDGRGVNVLQKLEDLDTVPDQRGFIEEMISEKKEISVIVARNDRGEVNTFPSVEMEFHPTANLVEMLISPSTLNESEELKVRELAGRVADAFELVGVMAVELFLTNDGKLYVNEVAPRPHNSGHQTIEGNYTSQYGQHLRAILGLPLGNPERKCASVMVNVLGEPGYEGEAKYEGLDAVLEMPGTAVHLYGKKETRPFRKMGHVTIVAEHLEDAVRIARSVKNTLKVIA